MLPTAMPLPLASYPTPGHASGRLSRCYTDIAILPSPLENKVACHSILLLMHR